MLAKPKVLKRPQVLLPPSPFAPKSRRGRTMVRPYPDPHFSALDAV